MLFWHLFGPLPGSKMLENEPPKLFLGPDLAENHPKSLKNQPGPPQGPPGTPTAAQRPPGIDLGAFWAPFWGLLGCIFEPPRSSILGAMLPSFLAFLPFFPASPFFPPRKQRHQAANNASNRET